MWPQALQMTRDECRGILRRLELESYSHVISVFRAQGGLSENKAKLLEELRTIFHISQERHRAEARRVANDEQLSTIAEAISGPNTWQEWSREGRRSYPMLPRVAPQTALALIANSVAAETAAENAKLPYPSDTAAPIAAEQAAHAEQIAAHGYNDELKQWNIVSSDPFKVPDIPVIPKKTLKRNLPDSQNTNNKRRSINDAYASNKHLQSQSQQQQQQQKQKQQQVYDEDEGDEFISNSNIRKLYHNYSKIQQQQQQQKGYQQQQQQNSKQKAKRSGTAQTKRQTTAKGKRAQQQKQQQQKQQLELQQQMKQQQQQQQQQEHHIAIDMDLEPIEECKETIIAVSKKDISNNLSKLQIPATSLRLQSFETAVSNNNNNNNNIAAQFGSKSDKQLISTPVQKYIVEERQSPAMAAVAVQSAATTPQIMTLPQMSAAGNQLRKVNTTLVAPTTKLSVARKLPTAAENVQQQQQTYNIIDGNAITTSMVPTAHAPPATPTHTPPAIIQLNNSNIGNEQSLIQPSQSKVLTTKLLPIVLSGNSASKIETLNNGATIVGAGSSTIGGNAVYKTLPSSMLMSGAVCSTVGGSAHTVFRKQPNIIKTGIIGGTGTGKITTNMPAAGTSGAQIISNIKLSPAVLSSSSAATATSTSQFLKNVAGSGIRTSVKICQSPNGKMFIQPATGEGLKTTKLQTCLQKKLLSSQFSSQASGIGTTATTTGPQRIAIQKVQIIPAPMSSPGSLGGGTHQPQKTGSSLALSNKANMIFMPTTCGARGTPTISLSKSGHIPGPSTMAAKQQQQQSDVAKQNVFVIGAVAQQQQQQQQQQQGLKSSSRESRNQMITEDTPVDILNMPIIVDNSSVGTTTVKSAAAEIGNTVTVLSNEILQQSHLGPDPSNSSAVVLGVTDWEMELDQATANAAANKAARTQELAAVAAATAPPAATKTVQQQHEHNAIVVDDNYDDVIVEESYADDEDGTIDGDTTQSSLNGANVGFVMVAANDGEDVVVMQQQPSSIQQQTFRDDEMQIDVVAGEDDAKKMKATENLYITSNIKFEQQQQVKSKELAQIVDNFDEAIEADMDENTAIEYIEEEEEEEDHAVESFDGRRASSRVSMKMRKRQEVKRNVADNNNDSINTHTFELGKDKKDAHLDVLSSNLISCSGRGDTTTNKSSLVFEQTATDMDIDEIAKYNVYDDNK